MCGAQSRRFARQIEILFQPIGEIGGAVCDHVGKIKRLLRVIFLTFDPRSINFSKRFAASAREKGNSFLDF